MDGLASYSYYYVARDALWLWATTQPTVQHGIPVMVPRVHVAARPLGWFCVTATERKSPLQMGIA